MDLLINKWYIAELKYDGRCDVSAPYAAPGSLRSLLLYKGKCLVPNQASHVPLQQYQHVFVSEDYNVYIVPVTQNYNDEKSVSIPVSRLYDTTYQAIKLSQNYCVSENSHDGWSITLLELINNHNPKA